MLGQVSDIDIRLLRVYRAVVESGGVSAAELELNIGRSTISRHLKDLEVRLGVVLCHRGRSGFALTTEGTQIYRAAQKVLTSLSDFRTEVHGIHQRLSGDLTLCLFDKTLTNPQAQVHVAIGRMRHMAPRVGLEVFVEPTNEVERGVLDGRYSIGIIPTFRRSNSCEYTYLFSETMVLYCGHLHPLFDVPAKNLSDEALRNADFVGLGFHSQNMETGHELGLRRSATAYDQEGVATCIISGAFTGFLPTHYAAEFVARGQMRALVPERYTYQCHFDAIIRRSPRPTRLQQTFMELLVEAHPAAAVAGRVVN